MASPKIEVFFLYDMTGAPLAGLTPAFNIYKDDEGADLDKPDITEIGGGAYKFTPDITTIPDRGIVYIIDGGVTSNPRYLARYVRPEDYAVDYIEEFHQLEFGKWQIVTSGGDANKLVIYKPDGVTVLKKFALADKNGLPTSTNPYRRTPL